MYFGLMLIALLIANLHAAVFYVFFIFFMPYVAEYFIVLLRDSDFAYKIKAYSLKRKIEKLSIKVDKSEKTERKLQKLKENLAEMEEKHVKIIANKKKRAENPYKVRLVKRDAGKWLILIMILCFAMGLLTPIGDEPYTHIIKLMSGNTTQSISEHQPLIIAGNAGAIVVAMLLFGLIIFTDTKITLKDLFMLGGLIVLTIMSRRQFSLLLIIGVISFTKMICDFTNKYDKNGTVEFTNLMVTWRGRILTLILIVLCSYCVYKPKIGNEYVNSSLYPIDAANFMLEEEKKGNLDFSTMRLYNDYNYGSYLLFRGIPVFIDSRADLYSPEFNEGVDIFSDYMNMSGIGVHYENNFNKYGITHAITYTNSKINLFFSRDDNLKEIYKDKNFVIYERLNVDTSNDEE